MIKKLCKKTYNKFISKNKEDKNKSVLYMRSISKYAYNNFLSLSDLEYILKLERKLLSSSGKYKTIIEKEIFHIIKDLVDNCMEVNDYETIFLEKMNKKEIMEDEDNFIIYLIIEFSLETFYHKKERDSFNTKRKIIIIEILTIISFYYKQESVYELSLACLKSKKQGVAIAGNDLKNAYLSNEEA